AVCLHAFDAAGIGDDGVGPARGEFLAARGAAGLAYRRTALRRARRVQRAAAPEVLALEVHRMDLAAVGEHRRVAVDYDGVGFPGIPELRHKVGEFVGEM